MFHKHFCCVAWVYVLPLLSLAGCRETKTYRYAIPEKTNDGWDVASLASEKIDDEPIKEMIERIYDNTYKNIHSVLVIKNGKLVLEEYFPGYNSDRKYRLYDRDTIHEVCSISKSVNAILIGIAIDQHLITDVDQKISTLMPGYSDVFADTKKDEIRLKHLLTMTTGLAWDEWKYPYEDPRNDYVAMNDNKEPVRYVLQQPLVAEPGKKFVYNTGGSVVLGEIIHQVSGIKADKFAEQHLFKPLGISRYIWSSNASGFVRTGSGLGLRPRDMAKVGYLYLNGGRWQTKQVVSEEWVKASIKNCVDAKQFPEWHKDDGYGYQWWIRSFKVAGRVVSSYHAPGQGGQFIFVVPDLQLVAVFTGWNDDELALQPFEMLERYILPAAMGVPAESTR